MVYDDALAARVRSALADHAPAEEKAMFGGLAFMVEDHMAVAMTSDGLMVRVGADGQASVDPGRTTPRPRHGRDRDVRAETVGFEPTEGLPLHDLSRVAH